MKLVYKPFAVILGLFAGFLSKKLFDQIWGLIDKEEPPHPQHRETGGFPKLIGALLLEGAIFRLVRGLADHGARHGVARIAGTWPGSGRSDPE